MACRNNRIGCGGNGMNYVRCARGIKTAISSRLVDGGKYRQVEYANGYCDKIARTWVPQTYNTLPGNGPKPLSRCVGGNINSTDSECMDYMNGMFNSGVR